MQQVQALVDPRTNYSIQRTSGSMQHHAWLDEGFPHDLNPAFRPGPDPQENNDPTCKENQKCILLQTSRQCHKPKHMDIPEVDSKQQNISIATHGSWRRHRPGDLPLTK